MDYNLNTDRLRKIAEQKFGPLNQATQSKADNLAPDTLKIRSQQMADLDSTLDILDQGKFRVANKDKGYYPDAYESSNFRYTPQPEDSPEVKQRKAATLAAHQRSYANKYGLEPDEVRVEDLVNEGIRQKEKVLPEFAARGAQEGEEPVLTVQPHSPGESTYGRQLAEVTNPAGEELSKAIATDPEQNANFQSAYNAQGIFESLAKGQTTKKVGQRPKTAPEFFGDIYSQVWRGAASGVAKGVIETGQFFDPGNLVAAPFGGKGALKTAFKALGIDEKIAAFDERTAEGMSAPERYGKKMQEKRYQAYLETRDRKKAKLEAGGISGLEAEADLLTDDVAFVLRDLKNNPLRVVDLGAQALSSIIPIIGGGITAGALKARSLALKNGKEFLNTDAGRKALAQIQGITGISIGALQEGANASFEKDREVREMSKEDISKSELYQNVLKQTGSHEKAVDAVANQASSIAFAANAALIGMTSAGLGAIGLSGSKALAQTRRVGTGPLGYRGTTRTAVEVGAKAFPEGFEEAIQGAAQSIISSAQTSAITGKENPHVIPEAAREAVMGAVGGGLVGGAVGGQRQARTEIFGDKRTPTFSEKPQNKVTFRNPEQEEGVKPELKRILENVGMDIDVTSGYRSAGYNDKIGAVKGSRHVHGDAVDISLAGLDDTQKKTLLKRLYNNGITAAITYEGSDAIHIDMHKRGNQEFSLLHSPTGKGQDASFRHRVSAPQWAQEAYAEIQAQGGNRASNIYTEERVVGRGRIPNTPYARDINQGIQRAVEKHGLPPIAGEYLRAITDIESSWGRRIVGKTIGSEISGAKEQYGQRAQGPFQFMPNTAASYGLKDRNDPYASSDAAARMLKDSYEIQKKKNPNLSEEELWHRAAISHHSGSAWNTLGKWGKDYDQKLRARVGKYGTAVAAGVSVPGGQASAADISQANSESLDNFDKPAPVKKEDIGTTVDNILKKYKEASDTITKEDLDTLGKVKNNFLINLENEIERLDKAGNVKEADKLVEQASNYEAQFNEISRAYYGPQANRVVAKVKQTLGSPEGTPEFAETGIPDEDIPEEFADLSTSSSTRGPAATETPVPEGISTEKTQVTKAGLGSQYSSVLSNDELSTLLQAFQHNALDEGALDTIKKASDKVIPQAFKQLFETSNELGKKQYDVRSEKFGFFAPSVEYKGKGPSLGLEGHRAKINALMAEAVRDPNNTRVGEITNAFNALNSFVDSQAKKLNDARATLDKGIAAENNGESFTWPKNGSRAKHERYVNTLAKEQDVLDDVFDNLLTAYQGDIASADQEPSGILKEIQARRPEKLEKLKPYIRSARLGNLKKQKTSTKQKKEEPAKEAPVERDLKQFTSSEYRKYADYLDEGKSSDEAYDAVIAERTKAKKPEVKKEEKPIQKEPTKEAEGSEAKPASSEKDYPVGDKSFKEWLDSLDAEYRKGKSDQELIDDHAARLTAEKQSGWKEGVVYSDRGGESVEGKNGIPLSSNDNYDLLKVAAFPDGNEYKLRRKSDNRIEVIILDKEGELTLNTQDGARVKWSKLSVDDLKKFFAPDIVSSIEESIAVINSEEGDLNTLAAATFKPFREPTQEKPAEQQTEESPPSAAEAQNLSLDREAIEYVKQAEEIIKKFNEAIPKYDIDDYSSIDDAVEIIKEKLSPEEVKFVEDFYHVQGIEAILDHNAGYTYAPLYFKFMLSFDIKEKDATVDEKKQYYQGILSYAYSTIDAINAMLTPTDKALQAQNYAFIEAKAAIKALKGLKKDPNTLIDKTTPFLRGGFVDNHFKEQAFDKWLKGIKKKAAEEPNVAPPVTTNESPSGIQLSAKEIRELDEQGRRLDARIEALRNALDCL